MIQVVAIAAAGTGGHLFPALALADALAPRFRTLLLTDARGAGWGPSTAPTQRRVIASSGVAGRRGIALVTALGRLGWGSLQAWRWLRATRPAGVVGFGGYGAAGPVLAAVALGLKTMIHEQNASPGRANRLLARWADRIAVSFDASATDSAFPAQRVVVTGTPVRAAIAALARIRYQPPSTDEPLRLLITGGSQGAAVFGTVAPEAMRRLSAALRARLRVTHQARPGTEDAVRAAYAGAGVQATVCGFIDDMPTCLGAAHLTLCRAGASTIAELTAAGRPAILIPYPEAADDHQTANAAPMVARGGGWMIAQAALTPEALAMRLEEVLTSPDALAAAAAAAARLGRPDAAAQLAAAAMALFAPEMAPEASTERETP